VPPAAGAAREERMIRRTVGYGESDQRVVTWALVAATFGLAFGFLAEHTLAARSVVDGTTVAEQPLEVRPAAAVQGAS
jgi:hypothetical protein